ncbi:MAG: AAA family ATPase [Treponema sp.]|nr:AAA family ATPase [Treponema sp.]
MTKEYFESKLKTKLSENDGYQSVGNTLMLLGIKKEDVANFYNLPKTAKMNQIFENIPFVELNQRNDQFKLKENNSSSETITSKSDDMVNTNKTQNKVGSAEYDLSNKSLSERIKTLLTYLNQNLYGKEEAVRLALLSAVANESIFFMGPPGTGKSMIGSRIAAAFNDFYKDGKFSTKNGGYFGYTMNEFSTPDEICGPVKLSALNEQPSRYERQTNGCLPSAKVAFLDEIWKSGPAILNTLLTIINEKKFHNGSKIEEVPLVSLAAASNELPEKNRGLEALWDRFILRVFVNPVENEDDFFKLVDDDKKELVLKDEYKNALLEIGDVEKWQTEIDKIELSDEARNVITAIRQELVTLNADKNHKAEDGENYYVSDRRWKKIVHILKTSAFLNGRKAVDLMDCSLIEYAIWNTDKQHEEVTGIDDNIGIVEKILKQNGIRFNTESQVIKDVIKEFDKFVDKQFYMQEPSKPSRKKMQDNCIAYELKKTIRLNVKYNSWNSSAYDVKFISNSNYYNEKGAKINNDEQCCSKVKFNADTNELTWQNDDNYDNQEYSQEVVMIPGSGLVKDPTVFGTSDLLELRQKKADSKWYEKILQVITKSVDELDDFKQKQEKPFKENQFAKQKYCDAIMETVNESRTQIEDLKVELDKIRARYVNQEENI